MSFDENALVKIPATLYLPRLWCGCLSPEKTKWDESTDFFPEIFIESITNINSMPMASIDGKRAVNFNSAKAKKQLIRLFEQKFKDRIARVWGPSASAAPAEEKKEKKLKEYEMPEEVRVAAEGE